MTDNLPPTDPARPTFQAAQPPDPTPAMPTFQPAQPAQPTFQHAPVAPIPPVAATRPAARKRGIVDVVLVIAAIFAVGGVGFALGRATAPAAVAQTANRGNGGGQFGANGGQFPNGGEFPNGGGQGGNGGAGGNGFGGGRGLGLTLTGQVTDISADHLTLKLASGQSIQVGLGATTTYNSQTPATAAAVTTGSTVQIQVSRAGGATGGAGGGTGNGGTPSLGDAASVTVVPK
jgi:hypothetical protein